MKPLIALLFFLNLPILAHAQFDKTYDQMLLLDLESFQKTVFRHVQLSKRRGPSELKKAVLVALSRPNEDAALSKVWTPVYSRLLKTNSYQRILKAVMNEAMTGLKNDKLARRQRATYVTVLYNLIAITGSRARSSQFDKEILVDIWKAELKVPEDVKRLRRMKTMRKTPSPSRVAEAKLDEIVP